jgi:hypothetical protein
MMTQFLPSTPNEKHLLQINNKCLSKTLQGHPMKNNYTCLEKIRAGQETVANYISWPY